MGITMLKTKMTPSDFDKLMRFASIGVYAVEQIYRNFDGEEIAKKKFEEVKKWIESKNLKVNEEDIEKAIEAAVIRMKQELASNQKNI